MSHRGTGCVLGGRSGTLRASGSAKGVVKFCSISPAGCGDIPYQRPWKGLMSPVPCCLPVSFGWNRRRPRWRFRAGQLWLSGGGGSPVGVVLGSGGIEVLGGCRLPNFWQRGRVTRRGGRRTSPVGVFRAWVVIWQLIFSKWRGFGTLRGSHWKLWSARRRRAVRGFSNAVLLAHRGRTPSNSCTCGSSCWRGTGSSVWGFRGKVTSICVWWLGSLLSFHVWLGPSNACWKVWRGP